MAGKPEMKDPLTGLPKKTEFEEILGSVVNADGKHSPVSLALFDIDHFLRVNENYGHERGDEVILVIAKLFESQFPENQGWICRIHRVFWWNEHKRTHGVPEIPFRN